MAIAAATLEHLTQSISPKTLFITHYPEVALSAARAFPTQLSNLHMGFTEETAIDGKRVITFLYRVEEGIASGSYGIECARLAAVPEELLKVAARKAEEMQGIMREKINMNR